MSEKPPEGTPRQWPRLTPENEEIAKERLQDIEGAVAAEPSTEMAEAAEAGPAIEALEGMMDAFEAEHSVAALYQIDELSPETHAIRDAARRALMPITDALVAFERKIGRESEEWQRLRVRQKNLTMAAGALMGNKIDHTP